MKRIVVCMVLFTILVNSRALSQNKVIGKGWEEKENILARIQPPVFPEKLFVITDFGAKDDGTLCTEAFRKAIVACNAVGGGRVVVPKGSYVTGAIHLLSNVELHISEGATVVFSANPKDYLPIVLTRYEGCELYNYSPLIYSYKQENIAITGKGVLDGQASIENWWNWVIASKVKEENLQNTPNSIPRLMNFMTEGIPTEQRIFGEGSYLRPSFIQPYLCKNILIDGVTVKRPPMWMIHPVLSENITIRDVKLFSPGAPNGDGCDPEACKNVLIERCEFNTGDDCIAIKSGRNKDGYDRGIPTENVVIRYCKMLDGHGGITIGSETSGGVRNIYAYGCEMSSPHLDIALRFKSNKYRGGVIENIHFHDINIGEVKNAVISINQNYFSKEIPREIKYTTYKNIFVEKIVCDKAENAIQINGLKEHPVEDVEITNCRFNKINNGIVVEAVNGLVLTNVIINGEHTKTVNN